jgi:hypothetical protein
VSEDGKPLEEVLDVAVACAGSRFICRMRMTAFDRINTDLSA